MIFPETSISVSLGHKSIGDQSCVRGAQEIQRNGGTIIIGKRYYIGDHTRIWAANSISIGDDVLIAHNVNVFDNDTHPTDYLERRRDADNIIRRGIREEFKTLRSAAVEIGNDAWIGCNSIILKGVKIGGGYRFCGQRSYKGCLTFNSSGWKPCTSFKAAKGIDCLSL